MAGLGFKDFTAGEVLTAADVDGYLMQQAVMVFDDDAARTAAIGAFLAEGMLTYRKDGKIVEQYDGTAWGAVGVDSFTTTGNVGEYLVSNGTAGVVWDNTFTSGTTGQVIVSDGAAGVKYLDTYLDTGTAGQTVVSAGTAGITYENSISPLLLMGA